MIRFFLFLLRVQWIDRLATSAFLIGITLQTFLLTASLTSIAESPEHAVVLATRAALLTSVGIILFSAMSNIQNEHRYGTMKNVLLSGTSFERLLWIRSASTAVVSSPAILVPFAGAAWIYPALLGADLIFLVAMVYLFLACLCHQSTLILNSVRDPALFLPWLRAALLILGLTMIPFPGGEMIALFFPTGWILRFAISPGLEAAMIFLLVTAAWTGTFLLLLRGRVERRIERNLTGGKMSV